MIKKKKQIIVLCVLYIMVVFLWKNIEGICDGLLENIKGFETIRYEYILDNMLYAQGYVKNKADSYDTYNRIVISKIEDNMNAVAYMKLKEGVDLVTYTPSIKDADKINIDTNNGLAENETTEQRVVNYEASDIDTKAVETFGGVGLNYSKVVLSNEQLADFDYIVNNFYVITDRAKVVPDDINGISLLQKDMSMHGSNENPQILIYHTHSKEKFSDSTEQGMSIVEVGTYLAEILSKDYGYNVIHVTRSFDEVNGVFDRSKAYTYATPVIEQILEENPSIEVVLDVHRDGLPEGSDKLLYDYNGRAVAQIMFFNGISRNNNGDISYLYNPYREDNLAFSFQLKLKALENFPGFTRRNYIDAYQYNLHLRAKSVLIEVGAQNNTFEEAKYAMNPLAELLDSVLSPK